MWAVNRIIKKILKRFIYIHLIFFSKFSYNLYNCHRRSNFKRINRNQGIKFITPPALIKLTSGFPFEITLSCKTKMLMRARKFSFPYASCFQCYLIIISLPGNNKEKAHTLKAFLRTLWDLFKHTHLLKWDKNNLFFSICWRFKCFRYDNLSLKKKNLWRGEGIRFFTFWTFLFANTITATLCILFKAKVTIYFYCSTIPRNEMFTNKVFVNLLPNFYYTRMI